jgi:hypothetical protein
MNREIKFRAIIPEMCEVIGNIIEKKGKRVK